MRVEFESPSVVDASELKADDQGRAAVTSFRPHVRKGQNWIFVGYIHAIGDSGRRAISRLAFNPHTGKFQVQDVTAPSIECAFDAAPDPVVKPRPATRPAARPETKHEPASPLALT